MKADLHTLEPNLADANQDRSTYRFAIIGPDSVDQWESLSDFELVAKSSSRWSRLSRFGICAIRAICVSPSA